MSGIFVEYYLTPEDKGYSPNSLRKQVVGRGTLDFLPREEHNGLRVEEFSTEQKAQRFVSSNPAIFRINRTLIGENERVMIREYCEQVVAPLITDLQRVILEELVEVNEDIKKLWEALPKKRTSKSKPEPEPEPES